MRNLLFLILTGFAHVAFADYCSETKIITEEFDASAFSEMELKALAGELEVTPSDDGKIHFWGKVCTDTEAHLDMIDLDILKTDEKLTLVAIIPYHQDDFDPSYALMDIELSLPADMPLRLRDSSGDMLVKDVAVYRIEDSSGDMRVIDGRSDLTIRDSSGRVQVRGLDGSVTVSDSSGDIDLRDIARDVKIPGDSSGDISVRGVGGNVSIDSDGSGDIEVEQVEMDVVIGSDGSGDIDIEEVKGQVRIEADGSGGISVHDVAGNFKVLNKGSGEIDVGGVDGEVDIP